MGAFGVVPHTATNESLEGSFGYFRGSVRKNAVVADAISPLIRT
jgi:hypothetical protein